MKTKIMMMRIMTAKKMKTMRMWIMMRKITRMKRVMRTRRKKMKSTKEAGVVAEAEAAEGVVLHRCPVKR
jgi:hypothetical protein